MTKRHTDTRPAASLSPYLSLRESVRPAIFAYNLLEKEQGQAAVLAAEISSLLKATEDLLAAAGLFHMLSSGPQGDADPTGDGSERQARLIKAYSEAGMRWARIVGNCLNLADALLADSLWGDARRLASYVKAAGEPGVAADITARINAAQKKAAAEAFLAKCSDFLRHHSAEMSATDINNAISLFREGTRSHPLIAPEIERQMRRPLIESMAKYHVGVQERAGSTVSSIPEMVNYYEQMLNIHGWEGVFNNFEQLYRHWY